MDLKELLGQEYKDNITIDEIQKILSGKKLVDLASGAYISTEEYKNLEKKAKELEKAQKERMSEEEKRIAKDAELTEQLRILQSDKCKLIMEKEFAKAGFDEKEYLELIGAFTTEDSNTAIKFAKAVSSFRATDKASIEAQLKQESMQGMNNPKGDPNPKIMNKDEFNKLSYNDMSKLATESPDIFNEMIK